MLKLKFAGTGIYLPEEVIPNSFFEGRPLRYYDPDLESVVEKRKTSDEIFGTTGIMERRKSAPDEFPSDMGYNAAVQAIERAGITADSLVGIIFATVTEKQNVPSAACKVQEMLGIKNAFAYDINNACAGFPEGLIQANSRVLRRPGNYLVIGAETLTKIVDYSYLDATLFGDGAGAAVLVPTEEEKGIIGEYSQSDPFDGNLDLIFRDEEGMLNMRGNRVFRKAVSGMLDSARELKRIVRWDSADVYIPHQANARILGSIRAKVQKEGSIVYQNIEKYGNMSAATCPIALHEAIEDGTITEGKRVIIVSFGSGLVTSGVPVQF